MKKTPHNAEKGARLFMKLAEQNIGSAQFMLGSLYFNGVGVKKDLVNSYMWLSIARNNIKEPKLKEANQYILQKVEPQMTAKQILLANEYIESCIINNYNNCNYL